MVNASSGIVSYLLSHFVYQYQYITAQGEATICYSGLTDIDLIGSLITDSCGEVGYSGLTDIDLIGWPFCKSPHFYGYSGLTDIDLIGSTGWTGTGTLSYSGLTDIDLIGFTILNSLIK